MEEVQGGLDVQGQVRLSLRARAAALAISSGNVVLIMHKVIGLVCSTTTKGFQGLQGRDAFIGIILMAI